MGKKDFVWESTAKRMIALKLLYLGGNYHGNTFQKEETKTVESELFKALKLTKLIPESYEMPEKFSRAGRTDKGVSAAGQVVVFMARSRLDSSNEGIYPFVSEEYQSGDVNWSSEKELDYCTILNGTLPLDIRVLGWSPVNSNFGARFDCRGRIYKYLFSSEGLSIELMRKSCSMFIGEHDFRNFCKVTEDNQANLRRTVHSCGIQSLKPGTSCLDPDDSTSIPNGESNGGYSVFTIRGSGFLYHQVRSIMGILFLVGRGEEEPEAVEHLLDVERCTQKPNYKIADEKYLILHECHYDEGVLHFMMSENAQRTLEKRMVGHILEERQIFRTKSMLFDVISEFFPTKSPAGNTRRKRRKILEKDTRDETPRKIPRTG